MDTGQFEPHEGGVKIVFDVPADTADAIERTVGAAGFDVRRYYPAGHEPRRGGPAPGWTRLGAERPRREFSLAEEDSIVAAFDSVQDAALFTCTRLGVDGWTAGR